jgi:hypothetical protein
MLTISGFCTLKKHKTSCMTDRDSTNLSIFVLTLKNHKTSCLNDRDVLILLLAAKMLPILDFFSHSAQVSYIIITNSASLPVQKVPSRQRAM